MTMNRYWMFALAIAGAIGSNTALPAGSAQAGAAKAVVCQACHGPTGNSVNPEWPSLAGLGADYIAGQLQQFRQGKRQNPIMMPLAVSLSSQDMADLGAYFGSLVNTGAATGEGDRASREAGEKLYRGGDATHGVPACTGCHGPAGYGNEPARFPALRGQQAAYVVKQLNDYAAGARPGGPGGIMHTIAERLSADDIRELAAYVHELR